VSSGDRRIERLEALIGSGVPLHLPLAQWSAADIERVVNDPSLLDVCSLEELDVLGEQVRNLIRAGGGDPGAAVDLELRMSMAAPGVGAINAHGRAPFAESCGCGVCEVWRERRAGSTVAT
jgi:hypothetical protein